MPKRLTVLLSLFFIVFAASAFAANNTGLARLATAPLNADGSSDGVATFGGAIPSSAQLDALRALGLRVQGLDSLPLALLRGPRAAMFDAVSRGLASDVYPNERLRFYSAASDMSMRVNEVQTLGIDGSGVGVAIVDSGIDATHPDLAKRVTHNVKIIESDTAAGDLVIPVDQGPYNDSDTSSGHGTHCAGIVAADNTDGQVLGVAPGASLIGYGTGDAVFIFSILSAYNDIMKHRVDWKIRVASNSWGSSFRMFDPDEPINQATKAAHDAGVTVVFAAGNDTTEMSINPYSVAPWVIGVGAGSLNHQRADFSSGGIEFDDSTLGALPAGDEKHLAFTGDRIGLYHPSVSAPGVNIVSTGTTGVAVTSLPGGTASASGTSMACPHVAGVVALLLQKRPALSPDEVKSILQVTSTYMPSTDDASKVQPFYQSGYGWVDAKAAVDLAGRHRYDKDKALARLQQSADQAVIGDRDYGVVSTDYWTFTAAPATVNGTPDNKTYSLQVTSATKAIKALVSYPSLSYVGVNEFDYHLTLVDAAGTTVAESTASSTAGVSQFFVDLTKGTYAYGTWTINVRGDLGAQDQDTIMGIRVTLAVSQLTPQTRVPRALPAFTPTGSRALFFHPGAAGLATSAEGCNLQAGAPDAGLGTSRWPGQCQSGLMGYAMNYGADIPAIFTGAPLAVPMTVGGNVTLKFYLTDLAQSAWAAAGQNPRLDVELDAVDANGDLILPLGAGEWHVCNDAGVCNTGTTPAAGTYTMSIPGATIPAGARISVVVRQTGVVTSTSRTVYGGAGLTANYSDAGVTLTTGTLQ
jgi:serine protease AprX